MIDQMTAQNEFNKMGIVAPEVLKKYSKGDIQYGKDMSIKGEGEKRRIIIELDPEDPVDLNDLIQLREIKKQTTPDINKKKDIERSILYRKITEYESSNNADFRKRVQDRAESTGKLREDTRNFSERNSYLRHFYKPELLEIRARMPSAPASPALAAK